MSITKVESIDTQRTQLEHFQSLYLEYNKEYRRVGYQIYKSETLQSSLKTLVQLVVDAEEMDLKLESLFETVAPTFKQAFTLLIIKNALLRARIKQSLLVLNGCLIVRKPDEDETPSFETLQPDLGFCLDAIVFHKGMVFYASQLSKKLYELKVPDHKKEDFTKACSTRIQPLLGFAEPEELLLIQSLLEVGLPKRTDIFDYIDIIKDAEYFLYTLVYKNDEGFQEEMYHALTQASSQLDGNKDEWELVARYPVLMETFSSKCSDNCVKLSYYYSRIVEEADKLQPLQVMSAKSQNYKKLFLDIYRKVKKEFDTLLQQNKLDALKKAQYLKINFYAYHVELLTKLSLQGYKIVDALEEPVDQNEETFIKKYLQAAFDESQRYLASNTELLLCQDVQDIIMDRQAIADYFEITINTCNELMNQISFILKMWIKVRFTAQVQYKKSLYQELSTYLSMTLHYYACFDLINNYLTEDKRIMPEFDQRINAMKVLVGNFDREFYANQLLDGVVKEAVQSTVSDNQKALLAQEVKKPRKHKHPPRKKQTVVVNNEPQDEASSSEEEQALSPERLEIELSLDKARLCITKKEYKGARSSFWQAYNLAINGKYFKGKLEALDGLCHLAGLDLTKQLGFIETLAKNPRQETLFQEEARALLNQLPKLRNTYATYFKLVDEKDAGLSLEDKKAIAFSRDIFWKQLITVQTKLKDLLELNAKRKLKSKTIKPKTTGVVNPEEKPINTLHQTLEKHFDDMVSEHKSYSQVVRQQVIPLQIKVNLPPLIQAIFKFLARFKGQHYLVGSMVMQLALQEFNLHPIVVQDADFITTHTNRADLIIAGFQENYYRRNLYSLYGIFAWPLDLVALPEDEHWLMNCLCSRDFTIAALSCDKDGLILDATGQGFEDLKQGRLVMIGCPKKRLQQDPVVVLRALKYMVFGFKPDDALQGALEDWMPELGADNSKLLAVARKHLLKAEIAESFLALLCQYQLLTKMFNVQQTSELMPLLGIKPSNTSALGQHGLFSVSKKETQGQAGYCVNTI